MRFLTFLLSLTLGLFAVDEHFERGEDFLMKMLLRDAKATSVNMSKSPKLPDKRDLAVCVYTPAQSKVRADFGGWLSEWNKADGVKQGHLELTDDASQADVILARLVTPWKTHEQSDSTYTSGIVGTDPVTRRPVTQPEMPVATYSEAKVYLYVIEREPGGGLSILWRGTDTARSDQGVVGTFPKESGASVHQEVISEIDAKGLKDKKRAGDRLRDQFFKMMRERSQG
jgi:hypothetical protein